MLARVVRNIVLMKDVTGNACCKFGAQLGRRQHEGEELSLQRQAEICGPGDEELLQQETLSLSTRPLIRQLTIKWTRYYVLPMRVSHVVYMYTNNFLLLLSRV